MYILDSLKNKLTLESSLYSRKSNTSIDELEGFYLEKFDDIFEVTARRKPEEDSLSTINKSNNKRIYYLDEKSSDTIIFILRLLRILLPMFNYILILID